MLVVLQLFLSCAMSYSPLPITPRLRGFRNAAAAATLGFKVLLSPANRACARCLLGSDLNRRPCLLELPPAGALLLLFGILLVHIHGLIIQLLRVVHHACAASLVVPLCPRRVSQEAGAAFAATAVAHGELPSRTGLGVLPHFVDQLG